MTQKNIRRKALAFVYLPLAVYMAFFEYYDWGDSALALYLLCVGALTITIIFWAFWWYKSIKPPSTIFKILGILLAGIDFIMINQAYARYLMVTDWVSYQAFIRSDYWAYRISWELVIFLWLPCWIAGRLFGDEEKKAMSSDKLKVLLIEDDKNISDLMTEIIASMNAFIVDRAYNYKEAISLFEPDKYVCCVIDLNLGSSTDEGVELASYFRDKDHDVFLAVVSGYFDEIFDERLLESVDDFLHKPFDVSVFKLKVFLWAIKYRRRLQIRRYIEGSDIQVKSELMQTLDERISQIFNRSKGE